MGRGNWAAGAVLLNILLGLVAGPAGAQAARTRLQEDEFYRTSEDTAPYESWLAAVQQRVQDSGVKDAKPGRFFDADVGVKKKDGDVTMFVDLGGKGQYKKVQDAIDDIPSDKSRSSRYVIKLNPGIYYEQLIIPSDKPYVTLQGSGQWNTKISWKEDLAESGSDVTDAAAQIAGDHFTAMDISFENTSPAPTSGAVGKQATALEVSGDMAAFVRVGFFGYQDTLYDKSGRHYFQDAYIQGSIDFIYGDGQSYYTNSELHVIPVQVGSLTAQKRASTKESTGYSFVGCKVTGEGYVYLGRAWGPASRTVFSHTYLANLVIPAGWMDWDQSKRDKTVFYGEYENYGPGATTQGRVSYSHDLSNSQAGPFQTVNFVDGYSWLSDAGMGKN